MSRPGPTTRYTQLDPAEIIRTTGQLADRIGARFPNAGLRSVCGRLVEIAQQARERSEAIARPLYLLRASTATLAALIVVSFAAMVYVLAPRVGQTTLPDFIQAIEAGIQELVFIGAAILFLVTFESRVKRRRALAAIHELRVVAHIIDMHQLTKDPEHIMSGRRRTAVSPRHDLTPFELERYLDYCSEMLALLGKIAALYVQHFEDSQAVAAVNDVEQLTSDLSRKIWQKIMILHTVGGAELSDQRPADGEVTARATSDGSGG
jgi:hypothetical protein